MHAGIYGPLKMPQTQLVFFPVSSHILWGQYVSHCDPLYALRLWRLGQGLPEAENARAGILSSLHTRRPTPGPRKVCLCEVIFSQPIHPAIHNLSPTSFVSPYCVTYSSTRHGLCCCVIYVSHCVSTSRHCGGGRVMTAAFVLAFFCSVSAPEKQQRP